MLKSRKGLKYPHLLWRIPVSLSPSSLDLITCRDFPQIEIPMFVVVVCFCCVFLFSFLLFSSLFSFSWLQKTRPCAKSGERVSAKVVALPLPELHFQEQGPQRKENATYPFNFKLKTEILLRIFRSPLPRKKVRKASGLQTYKIHPELF